MHKMHKSVCVKLTGYYTLDIHCAHIDNSKCINSQLPCLIKLKHEFKKIFTYKESSTSK